MNRIFFHARFLAALLLALILWQGLCAARDNPRHEAILLTAFGTSVPEARKAFANIEQAYREAFPDEPIEWAYTSRIIRDKLNSQGENVQSVASALDKLSRQGVNLVRAQSLHIFPGSEHEKFLREIQDWKHANPDSKMTILTGRPLLESRTDGEQVADATLASNAPEPQTALVLMAHGNANGRAGLALEGMRAILNKKNPQVFMASVEGEQNFAELLADLEKAGLRKVRLAPFMLVAGDHARNDLAGPEADSWARRLEKAGFEVSANLAGLGELPGIPAILTSHTRALENPTTVNH